MVAIIVIQTWKWISERIETEGQMHGVRKLTHMLKITGKSEKEKSLGMLDIGRPDGVRNR